jgi:hypothetical protein
MLCLPHIRAYVPAFDGDLRAQIVLLLPDSDSERIPTSEDTPGAMNEKHDDFAHPSERKN